MITKGSKSSHMNGYGSNEKLKAIIRRSSPGTCNDTHTMYSDWLKSMYSGNAMYAIASEQGPRVPRGPPAPGPGPRPPGPAAAPRAPAGGPRAPSPPGPRAKSGGARARVLGEAAPTLSVTATRGTLPCVPMGTPAMRVLGPTKTTK